jgi:hypothetical protein
MTSLSLTRCQLREMLAAGLRMDRLTELAHLRLCHTAWAQGHPTRDDAATLADLCRCSRRAWPRLLARLTNAGWRSRRGSFLHPQALAILRQARAASNRRSSAARRRWEPSRAADAKHVQSTCNANAMKMQCMSDPHAMHSTPANTGESEPGTQPALKLKNDKVPSLLNVKPLERLALKGSAHEQSLLAQAPRSTEARFLLEVLEAMKLWSPKQAEHEAENWGGWWRLRFREDADKAQRILAEVRSMIREHRIRSNPGAAATDLWKRLP